MNEHISLKITSPNITCEPIRPMKTVFIFQGDKDWVIKFSKEKGIEFNKDANPDWKPNDFALEFIKCVERYYLERSTKQPKE